VFGGHSIGGVRTLRGKDGEWGIVCPNSWALWGVNGYCTIPLWLAEWAAIDRPRVLTIPDPEFFLETTKWRELLCLKTELDAWLKQQE
jgi:hypothetical protein